MFDAFDAFEVYEVKSKYYSISIEKSRIKNVSEEIENGYGVRVIKDGKLAFSSATNLDKSLVERLEKLVRISEDELDSFPSVGKRSVGGLYDKRLEENPLEVLKESFETIEAERSCEIASGIIEIEVLERRVRNDSGEVSEKATFFAVTLEAVHERGSAYEFDASRRADLDLEKLTEKVCSLAVDDSKAKKAERKVCDVALSPLAFHQLLYFSFYPSFNAENVVKGRSVLTGRKGERIIEKITIYDDPTLEGKLFSYSFDDEGVKAKRKTLLEDGILKEFLCDFKHSKILGEKAGNAFREDFDSLPKIHPSNVVVDVEKGSFEADFYVHSFIGAHTSNPVSGDFSLECMNSYQNGEPVRGAMLYGNVFELLKKVSCMSKNVRQVENTICGDVLFENVEVKA
ncbi:peptidase U62 modulator of DNA gyrase [Ferroglobus placidus DSM 10642]|uniref:Peptidase U62 modulator of DNA gyrase n=1 Tax=Ferroglobus placidus (strain DSM 10642 / AEDII12DO) TaxID=589924 RepID=D3RZP6_FERPA|nr:TldD/PmbA family protein [Ferroglobus placidus]ADC65959.1 peptidase U62 modulator of DNA gyrase [Ferroglobus placidus DSM 10642]